MPANQPRRTRRAKSLPSQTLFSILNHGMMKHQWPNWKSASVQSLWTDFFGVLENSLLLGKYYILSWSIGAVVIFWYKEQSATLFFQIRYQETPDHLCYWGWQGYDGRSRGPSCRIWGLCSINGHCRLQQNLKSLVQFCIILITGIILIQSWSAINVI